MPIYLSDGHTGWACPEGASLIIEATSPGHGTLPCLHGVIYACGHHEEEAGKWIADAGFTPLARSTPASHRWRPWPCGHVTAYDYRASVLGPAPVVPPPVVT